MLNKWFIEDKIAQKNLKNGKETSVQNGAFPCQIQHMGLPLFSNQPGDFASLPEGRKAVDAR